MEMGKNSRREDQSTEEESDRESHRQRTDATISGEKMLVGVRRLRSRCSSGPMFGEAAWDSSQHSTF